MVMAREPTNSRAIRLTEHADLTVLTRFGSPPTAEVYDTPASIVSQVIGSACRETPEDR